MVLSSIPNSAWDAIKHAINRRRFISSEGCGLSASREL